MARKTADRYRLSPAAENDLAGIWRYSAETWSVDQADTYLRDLDKRLHDLCRNPEVARERTEVSPAVRLYPYRSHLIIYRVEGDWVSVLRVVHNRRNWEALLGD
ncbi:type II toxin-antitoxin system RelE/ParE family toxin [Psychromarinibacter sp. S121]|uniref:type II toxin-antitoxin system RelE/ParE family toxin n=1 Tax=Psychromarinibacter sp. S121 TaxID=3415127 RepID=UPI003C7A7AD0